MARLTPFSYSFSTTTGNQGYIEFRLTGRELHSLTIHVETDNIGPILVSASVLIEGKKHQYGKPTAILDGDGYNAEIFERQQVLPLSRGLPNILKINWSNYCENDAVIIFTGTVKK